MDNLTMCQQFSFLTQMYTLSFICSNYNIYCDEYCQNDINNQCYCYCSNDNIFCYKRTYYYSRLFFALFIGILFSLICTCCYTTFSQRRTIKSGDIKTSDVNLPKYEDLIKK